jgi:hypothetical protein
MSVQYCLHRRVSADHNCLQQQLLPGHYSWKRKVRTRQQGQDIRVSIAEARQPEQTRHPAQNSRDRTDTRHGTAETGQTPGTEQPRQDRYPAQNSQDRTDTRHRTAGTGQTPAQNSRDRTDTRHRTAGTGQTPGIGQPRQDRHPAQNSPDRTDTRHRTAETGPAKQL